MSITKNGISVLSSYAEDIISKVNLKIKAAGGPLYYIENVLKESQVDYQLFSSGIIKVEIKVTKNGEKGKVITPVKVHEININLLNDWLLISTIANEWDLTFLEKYRGNCFLDIQGYIRNIDESGKKKVLQIPPYIFSKIYCIKATEEEILYVPKEIVELQKNKLLLVTKGKNGVDLYNNKKKYTLPVNSIIQTKNTLGAGDTFFADFVTKLYQENNVIEAVKHAIDATSQFLQEK